LRSFLSLTTTEDGPNDFNDAEAIAEAVQRPTMKFVATKTADQLDLQALHRVRERLVSQRTGIINQIRAFLLERGVAVRQGLRGPVPRLLHAELPGFRIAVIARCSAASASARSPPHRSFPRAANPTWSAHRSRGGSRGPLP